MTQHPATHVTSTQGPEGVEQSASLAHMLGEHPPELDVLDEEDDELDVDDDVEVLDVDDDAEELLDDDAEELLDEDVVELGPKTTWSVPHAASAQRRQTLMTTMSETIALRMG